MTFDQCLLALIPTLASLVAGRGLIHFFQLESYQFPGYFRTLRRNKLRALLPGVFVAAGSLLLYYLFDILNINRAVGWQSTACGLLMLPVACACGMLVNNAFADRRAKKPLVYTMRVKRLYALLFVVLFCLAALLIVSPLPMFSALLPLLLPFWIALAGLLVWPIEKLISECYFRDARRKLLRDPGLIRIGVTGSYGKTSVKHILGTILSEKYPTLITPASFNTPMGVTRCIRQSLTSSYQVFVAEMGARHVGDIKELCRLVRPTIGVITSVGPQHLETFKTLQRVTQTKYELIQALPKDSHSYFIDDGGVCRQLYQKTTKPKTLVSMKAGDADVWCEDVRVSAKGSAFTLCLRDGGRVECSTRLLGEHSILNILLAAAVAFDLRLSLRQIARGIEKLEPVKSRLELIANPGSFTIINDAFNSNPVGASAALRVLAAFPSRRIIITPGMVELGEEEEAFNRAFGREMASCVDIAIIVGRKRATPIIEGLTEGGFDAAHIHPVASLEESTQLLHTLVRPTDTVLYENDLPDNYAEA